MLFVAGLNIDVSTADGMPFPLTKFVPWAAFAQFRDGRTLLLEQDEIVEALMRQSAENPNVIAFDEAIATMANAAAIDLPA